MGSATGIEDTVKVERRAVHTRDPELTRELIDETYVRHRPKISGNIERFRFSLRLSAAGTIASDVLTRSMSTWVACEPMHQLAAAYLARGSIEIRQGPEEDRFGPGDVLLHPYGRQFEGRWAEVDLGVLRLDYDAVAQLAAQRTGTDPAAFRFLGIRAVSPAMGRYWRTVTSFVHRELAAEHPALVHPLVLTETETMLAAAALSVFPNTTLTTAFDAPIGYVGPAALRRAMAYIDTHAARSITLADIAAATGVTARALHYAFAHHHDTTPMGYLHRVRLQRAHRELQATDPRLGATVTAIARRWGFAKPSRFAHHYRRAYGVNPSHTLRA